MNKSETSQKEDSGAEEPHDLEEVLDRLCDESGGKSEVSIEQMMEAVGRRSFGPVILFFGLLAVTPLSGIPTIPSIIGILVTLISGQLLLGRKSFWLPQKLLSRSVPQDRFEKGLKKVRPAARFVDRFIRPRMGFMTGGIGTAVVAGFCVLIGATMPPLEIVPFLATTAGAALTAFGLSLIANDGLLAIIAMVISGAALYLAIRNFLL
ncbi:exopolysaccharide biosynthesis protein [Pelagicoccus sp. SDUM812002]|uniref:exopolysaccharide biosynthesis protein n=1 Tax=Pelagicoccus sp. SDUM812002 TaxID=3041266 RepID=UPI00280D7ED1|nr:exopolysaccharide biosynthesis protein [Pelagicoccus sp. SDUM812002]MDQ8184093.1 exopolysaccharide biosynthesis protein [Pelagicoccus sp. SDUM812002]